MSVNDLLTQEEIDALLSGKPGDDIIISSKGSLEEATSDNSLLEDWGDNEQIPALAILNRRYAQLFSRIFFNLLSQKTDVSVCGVNLVRLDDFTEGLYTPSSINIVQIHPLQGSALFVLDPDLVFMIVENYFGGDGKYRTRIKKTELTSIESRVIELLLEKIFVVLKKVWEPVMPLDFELIRSEVNSQFIGTDEPKETMVISSFCVEMGNSDDDISKGELQIGMPYSLLEDILGTDV